MFTGLAALSSLTGVLLDPSRYSFFRCLCKCVCVFVAIVSQYLDLSSHGVGVCRIVNSLGMMYMCC